MALLYNRPKARPRSIQLQQDGAYSTKSPCIVMHTIADSMPTTRSGGLCDHDSRPPPVSIYRSMLDVDTANIASLQSMAYDNSYPSGCIADDGTTGVLESSCNAVLNI